MAVPILSQSQGGIVCVALLLLDLLSSVWEERVPSSTFLPCPPRPRIKLVGLSQLTPDLQAWGQTYFSMPLLFYGLVVWRLNMAVKLVSPTTFSFQFSFIPVRKILTQKRILKMWRTTIYLSPHLTVVKKNMCYVWFLFALKGKPSYHIISTTPTQNSSVHVTKNTILFYNSEGTSTSNKIKNHSNTLSDPLLSGTNGIS